MLIRPSIRLALLPAALPLRERLKLAADAGFEGVEVEANAGPPETIRDAADRVGLIVHSVHCRANYSYPLSSGDPAIVAAGIKATISAIETARILGSDTMLLVTGMVDADTTYGEVFERSLDVIRREIVPIARQHEIVLGIENVWNGFLLSPMDFARYVDAFESPWVRAYLDIGNVVFGHPEGWIDLLGRRICSLHVKDRSCDVQSGRIGAAKIGEGDIDWAKVRAALERIEFSGWGVLAEPEQTLSRMGRRIYGSTVIRDSIAAWPGSPALLAGVQVRLARSLLGDVMNRFRRHIARSE